mmetsp:Transcript_37492/g.72649  ORF Transcript_37492/g.72649 Transcript_37492/m.72649 type:complete len:97 (-) Transcript_37492:66-356(-)
MKRKRYENWQSCFCREKNTKGSDALTPTATAYLDIDIHDGSPVHRIEIGLFGEDVPKTCANFLALCRVSSLAEQTERFTWSCSRPILDCSALLPGV